MNNPNQNHNHTEPRQKRQVQTYRAGADHSYRVPVTIENGSIGYAQERWVP